VAYAASLEHLLDTLRTRAPSKVDALIFEKRRVSHGLLSVGLKLHCLGEAELFGPLIYALGGEGRVLERNLFKHADAKFCLVLPPVGSARAAVLLLECLEEFTGCRMFNNRNVQLQVCSPGRLYPRNAALHAIGFYLGSDTLRQYALEDFSTTVSADYYRRGKRLVIYDAGLNGEFDGAFAWWARTPAGLVIRPSLRFLNGRTDVLVGPGSAADLHNINLIATLLVHAQTGGSAGYWSSLGELFTRDLVALLDRHLLTGLIEAPWIAHPDDDDSTVYDEHFMSALQELLSTYRAIVTSIPEEAHGDAS
jgi:hypothetical protein